MDDAELDDELDNVESVARQSGNHDIAVAIERLREEACTDESGDAAFGPEGLELPFYEEERELVFALALAVGSLLEAKYSDHRLDGAEPRTIEGVQG